jgi:membrane associated rhomboid family serine protease
VATEADRFLRLAALELTRDDAVRIVKAPVIDGLPPTWAPDWDDWDEVLAADRPGSRPAVYAFRVAPSDDPQRMNELFNHLVSAMGSRQAQRPSPLPVRVVAVFCLPSVTPSLGRRLTRSAPSQYFAQIKPELWVVDLSTGTLYAPKGFGLVPSNGQSSVRAALALTLEGGSDVTAGAFIHAERTAVSQRDAFVSLMRDKVPYVTYLLLAACWFMFAVEAAIGHGCWLNPDAGQCTNHLWLSLGASQTAAVEHGQWWRLFTEMFMHFGIMHIVFNSIALWSVGSLVERIYGSVRYALIYLVSGLLASVASFAWMAAASGQAYIVSGGASGAIFGIAGVVIALGARRSVVPRPVALQLAVVMGVMIVGNLVYDSFATGIDDAAHVGGLIVGIILGYVLVPRHKHEPAEPTHVWA